MNLPPVILVSSAQEAIAACAPGRRLTLLSAPGAAYFGGILWWQALVAAARRRAPELVAADILDCDDNAAIALMALRAGSRLLVLRPEAPGADQARAVAAGRGAVILPAPPPALAMRRRHSAQILGGWLARGDTALPLP
jgi:hypothetical protein